MPEFSLTLVTPEGTAFDGPADALTAPGQLGSFGLLAHHAPMIAGLKPGIMTVTRGTETSWFAVGEGVLEVSVGNQVTVLVDVAQTASGRQEADQLLVSRNAK